MLGFIPVISDAPLANLQKSNPWDVCDCICAATSMQIPRDLPTTPPVVERARTGVNYVEMEGMVNTCWSFDGALKRGLHCVVEALKLAEDDIQLQRCRTLIIYGMGGNLIQIAFLGQTEDRHCYVDANKFWRRVRMMEIYRGLQIDTAMAFLVTAGLILAVQAVSGLTNVTKE